MSGTTVTGSSPEHLLGRALGLLHVLRRPGLGDYTLAAVIDATVELEALDVAAIPPDPGAVAGLSWDDLLDQAAVLVEAAGDISPAEAGVFIREARLCHEHAS